MPAGRRVALIGNAGGLLILAADAAERSGLHVVQLSAATQTAIDAVAPDAAATGNPVDLLATAQPGVMQRVLELIADSGEVDACVLVTLDLRDSSRQLDGLELDWHHDRVPAIAVPLNWAVVSGTMPCIPTPERAMSALAKVSSRHDWLAARAAPVVEPPLTARSARRAVDDLLADDHDGWVPPAAAYDLLERIAIPTAPSVTVTTTAGAVAAAADVGLPCVLKADVAGVVHKADAGAVVLGVRSRAAVRRAMAAFRATFGDRLRGVVVQQQARPGSELLIGAVRDPAVGPLLLIGAGGRDAELLADRRLLAAPASAADIRRALSTLRIGQIIIRRHPEAIEGVVELAARVGVLIAAAPRISELDLNPVIVRDDGCVAVDVRIATRATAPQPLRRLPVGTPIGTRADDAVATSSG